MNIKKDFPILSTQVNGYPLTYLDNAATTQKPAVVIDAMANYYRTLNANVKRGIYQIGEETSVLYEQTREKVASFINAEFDEVIFTAGTTQGINFIAQAWGYHNIQQGDEIVVTELEHHSNFLPWQRLAQQKGARLVIAPVATTGVLDYDALTALINSKTKLIAITAQSNVTGIVTDLALINTLAKQHGALLLIDAAQYVAHATIDVKEFACDFLVFSAHKMFAPAGVGILYIKRSVQPLVEPYELGGGMVFEVSANRSTWLEAPFKYEAGTKPMADMVGLAAALDYIKGLDVGELQKHEAALAAQLVNFLQEHPDFTLLAPAEYLKKQSIVSFVHTTIHAHDVAAYLDQFGICVRAGNHCAQLLHKKLGVDSSVRASFSVYNTLQDVELLIDALTKLKL